MRAKPVRHSLLRRRRTLINNSTLFRKFHPNVIHMHYVYIIQSINFPAITYAGYTANLELRLNTHNSGGSEYTADYKPWRFVWRSFLDKYKALEFER